MIIVKIIPQEEQRYDTIGDWWREGDDIQIRVTKQNDIKQESLIAIHELIEMLLCEQEGISEESVSNFDKQFKGEGEPGDSPDAPYRKQHRFAENIERLIAHELNIIWQDYENNIYEQRR